MASTYNIEIKPLTEPIRGYNEASTYALAQSIPPIAPIKEQKVIKVDNWGGQCVTFISKITGYDFQVDARDIQPNSNIPQVGSLVLTTESKWGHIALIIEKENNELILLESNLHGDEKITRGRRLKIEDPRIRGYYTFIK